MAIEVHIPQPLVEDFETAIKNLFTCYGFKCVSTQKHHNLLIYKFNEDATLANEKVTTTHGRFEHQAR